MDGWIDRWVDGWVKTMKCGWSGHHQKTQSKFSHLASGYRTTQASVVYCDASAPHKPDLITEQRRTLSMQRCHYFCKLHFYKGCRGLKVYEIEFHPKFHSWFW
jgi:hypothetical protein